jgi:uncharacterized protein (TIGR03435 family)
MLKTLRNLIVACALASLCPAQQPASPRFEVASVKPTAGREIGGAYIYSGGRVAFRGCTFLYLTQLAFDVQEFQVAGAEGWMETDRFDIDAKAPSESKSTQSMPPYRKAPMNEEQRQMLQALLAERFGLRHHRETRERPIYLLVRTGKGLKMTDAKDKNDFPWSGALRGGMITGDGLAGTNEDMPDLAQRLSWYLKRPILDRTGLTGSYDFRTAYSQDDTHPDVIGMIMTCLNDLGLKLEPSKGPVERIVIDSALKPSAN